VTSRLKPWRRLGRERIYRCRIFDLDRVRFRPGDGRGDRDYFVVESSDWINVIPLTDDRRVVMVRQFRCGIDDFTLEIPGGMCDPGESPQDAAARELREETGYACRRLMPLGWVHPNPAIHANRCHTYLAEGAFVDGEPRPDPYEDLEVEIVPLDEVPTLIRDGTITHSLVISAFHRLGLREED